MILYFCHDYNIVRTSNNILICMFRYTSCNYNFINKYFTVILRHELDGGPEGHIWRVPAEVCANVPDELSVLAASPAGELHVGAPRSTCCLCGHVLVCLDQPVVLDQAQGLRDGRRTEASSVTNEGFSTHTRAQNWYYIVSRFSITHPLAGADQRHLLLPTANWKWNGELFVK